MPVDWPLAQLTLPAGSRLTCDAYTGTYHSDDKSGEWIVFFDSPTDWPALVAHVENCLRPLHYSEYYKADPLQGTDTRGIKRTYFSADGKTMVVLMDERGSKGCDYTLQVTLYIEKPGKLEKFDEQQQQAVKPVLRPL